MILIRSRDGAAGTLLFLFYSSWTRAVPIESQNGLFFGFAEVALIDLAARATPKGCERSWLLADPLNSECGSLRCRRRWLLPGRSQMAVLQSRFSERWNDRHCASPGAVPSRRVDAEQGRTVEQGRLE